MNHKLLFNNTYKKGRMTILVFKEKEGYKGVCLEFNLIIECPSFKEAEEHITDYAQAWLENVQKNKLPEELLNNPAPKKYWNISKRIDKQKEFKKVSATKSRSSNSPLYSSYRQYGGNFAFI